MAVRGDGRNRMKVCNRRTKRWGKSKEDEGRAILIA